MQRKTYDVAASAGQIDLEANVPKTKHMQMNSRSQEAIQLYGTASEDGCRDQVPVIQGKSSFRHAKDHMAMEGWQVKFTDQAPPVQE